MSAITVGGDLVHYEVLGRGRQVVLLHGWVGSWRYWIPLMQQLQASYRVYAVDLFGFGDSGKNPAKYTMDHQIELLADFMRELGIPKAAIIAHGFGAQVAAEYARRYPDNVARMMLVSPPLFNTGDLEHRVPVGRRFLQGTRKPEPRSDIAPNSPTIMSPSAAMRAALVEAARARAADDQRPQQIDATFARADAIMPPNVNPLAATLSDPETLLGRAYRRNEPEYDKLLVDVLKTDPRVIQSIASMFDAGHMLDTLRLLPMPTVVAHGMSDPVIPPPDDQVWGYVTADKEALLVPLKLPNVRHFPMLEYDRFFKLAQEFLETSEIAHIEAKERWVRRTR